MGRRRSSVVAQQIRLQRMFKERRKRTLKPPFLCPWCYQETMYLKTRKSIVFVYCTKCRKGEVMPLHPVFKSVDYYAFVVDKTLVDKDPVFRFKSMSEKALRRLQSLVTIGEIKVVEVC